MFYWLIVWQCNTMTIKWPRFLTWQRHKLHAVVLNMCDESTTTTRKNLFNSSVWWFLLNINLSWNKTSKIFYTYPYPDNYIYHKNNIFSTTGNLRVNAGTLYNENLNDHWYCVEKKEYEDIIHILQWGFKWTVITKI